MIDKELIQQAKEKLGDKNAELIVQALGIDDYDEHNMKCKCVAHVENTASFLYNRKKYSFHCFGCGCSVDLVDAYIKGKGMTFNQAVSQVFKDADMNVPMGEVGIQTKNNYRYPKLTENADMTPVYEYLGSRGISKAVVDYAGLSCDDKGNIELPFYDNNDVLKTVKLRPAHKVEKGKGAKCWLQKDTDHESVLFLQHLANPSEPLLITEGEIDCLAAIESGYKNTVSIPFGCSDMSWIDEQWEFLEQFDSIIVAGDNDVAGRKFNKSVIARLGQWRARAIQYPTSFVKPNGKEVTVSDTNEVMYYYGKEKVLECIMEAINAPIPTVVDFSNVRDYNLDEVGGVTFGIKELDKILMRSFEGSVTTLFAKPASGKTSLVNQLVSETMNDGKSVFLYSQELSNQLQSNWILYSLAGRRNINSFISKEGTPYYRVTPCARKAILEYYKKRLYLYKDGESIDIDDILKTAEMCVRRNGCALVVLDNLTCISCKGCESDLLRQTEIVRKCVKFALTYNVAVFLVAHSRKTSESLGMDDASGSMNIANLSHRMLAMERNTEGGVTVRLTKDRYLGKNGATVQLGFDYPSRRFFTTEEELNRVFDWDKGECLANNPPVSVALQQMIQAQRAEEEVFGA